MLFEVMQYCRVIDKFAKTYKYGQFEIVNKSISLPFLKVGQYFLLEGSIFNDGLYEYGCEEFVEDETFTGEIVGLAIPKDFLDLCEEIKTWQEKASKKNNMFVSESFNNYSYTKATNSNGETITWKDAFKERLKLYKRK